MAFLFRDVTPAQREFYVLERILPYEATCYITGEVPALTYMNTFVNLWGNPKNPPMAHYFPLAWYQVCTEGVIADRIGYTHITPLNILRLIKGTVSPSLVTDPLHRSCVDPTNCAERERKSTVTNYNDINSICGVPALFHPFVLAPWSDRLRMPHTISPEDFSGDMTIPGTVMTPTEEIRSRSETIKYLNNIAVKERRRLFFFDNGIDLDNEDPDQVKKPFCERRKKFSHLHPIRDSPLSTIMPSNAPVALWNPRFPPREIGRGRRNHWHQVCSNCAEPEDTLLIVVPPDISSSLMRNDCDICHRPITGRKLLEVGTATINKFHTFTMEESRMHYGQHFEIPECPSPSELVCQLGPHVRSTLLSLGSLHDRDFLRSMASGTLNLSFEDTAHLAVYTVATDAHGDMMYCDKAMVDHKVLMLKPLGARPPGMSKI